LKKKNYTTGQTGDPGVKGKVNAKAVHIRAWTSPKSTEMFRLPKFLDNWHM
jgi:hypothetical protein